MGGGGEGAEVHRLAEENEKEKKPSTTNECKRIKKKKRREKPPPTEPGPSATAELRNSKKEKGEGAHHFCVEKEALRKKRAKKEPKHK